MWGASSSGLMIVSPIARCYLEHLNLNMMSLQVSACLFPMFPFTLPHICPSFSRWLFGRDPCPSFSHVPLTPPHIFPTCVGYGWDVTSKGRMRFLLAASRFVFGRRLSVLPLARKENTLDSYYSRSHLTCFQGVSNCVDGSSGRYQRRPY